MHDFGPNCIVTADRAFVLLLCSSHQARWRWGGGKNNERVRRTHVMYLKRPDGRRRTNRNRYTNTCRAVHRLPTMLCWAKHDLPCGTEVVPRGAPRRGSSVNAHVHTPRHTIHHTPPLAHANTRTTTRCSCVPCACRLAAAGYANNSKRVTSEAPDGPFPRHPTARTLRSRTENFGTGYGHWQHAYSTCKCRYCRGTQASRQQPKRV